MKKTILILLVATLALNLNSCKKKAPEKVAPVKTFSIDADKTEVNWTAYKTTAKAPVKGKFTKLDIKNSKAAANLKEALNGAEFSIPVSSIFSNNPGRDTKLKTFFFGVMKNTSLLSGTIHVENDTKGYVDFSMNGVIEKLAFDYTVNETSIVIKAIMNTDTWQAQAAIESLNKACFELHKGTDGVSKTWSDVAIDITVAFK